ncbi:FHA domain-containing protein [bacterium]|nr:FHA domain-containing protein [bacterium]
MPPRTHVLKVGETVCLGRGREATIRVDDARVSRQHVNIILTPFGLEVEDLGSRNGTLLDDKPLPPLVRTPINVAGYLTLARERRGESTSPATSASAAPSP